MRKQKIFDIYSSRIISPTKERLRFKSKDISYKLVAWGPFLERPGNLTGPKSSFEIKFSRKVGCVLTSNEVHFDSLAENFTVQFSNVLKLLCRMKNKTAERAR